MTKAVLAIHGGAGAISRAQITPEKQSAYEAALRAVLTSGERILANGGSALDAVTEAVRLLEECPLFNAGHGAVFTRDGTHELDASIMDGRTRACGAVASLRTIRNPILAARAVMEHSPHVLFVGAGAEAFARSQGLEVVDPSFFSTPERHEQLVRAQQNGKGMIVLDHDGAAMAGSPLDESKKMGTVGAVALDRAGNLAAAASTGGLTNKWPGRVGDTPIIGAGCYASNASCAVACTGNGEAFIRSAVAYDIAALMEYTGMSLAAATAHVVYEKLPRIGGAGGLIAVDRTGHVALPFNTEGMYCGSVTAGAAAQVAIYRE